jgi:hypothetical protein
MVGLAGWPALKEANPTGVSENMSVKIARRYRHRIAGRRQAGDARMPSRADPSSKVNDPDIGTTATAALPLCGQVICPAEYRPVAGNEQLATSSANSVAVIAARPAQPAATAGAWHLEVDVLTGRNRRCCRTRTGPASRMLRQTRQILRVSETSPLPKREAPDPVLTGQAGRSYQRIEYHDQAKLVARAASLPTIWGRTRAYLHQGRVSTGV